MAYKIIIYDDDPDILFITRSILERNGFETFSREDCEQLEADLKSFLPQLILMDHRMPGRTGVEAIRYIKTHEDFKNIPVIFFSANNNLEQLALQAGADRSLAKPFDLATLLETINSVLPAEK